MSYLKLTIYKYEIDPDYLKLRFEYWFAFLQVITYYNLSVHERVLRDWRKAV